MRVTVEQGVSRNTSVQDVSNMSTACVPCASVKNILGYGQSGYDFRCREKEPKAVGRSERTCLLRGEDVQAQCEKNAMGHSILQGAWWYL